MLYNQTVKSSTIEWIVSQLQAQGVIRDDD